MGGWEGKRVGGREEGWEGGRKGGWEMVVILTNSLTVAHYNYIPSHHNGYHRDDIIHNRPHYIVGDILYA